MCSTSTFDVDGQAPESHETSRQRSMGDTSCTQLTYLIARPPGGVNGARHEWQDNATCGSQRSITTVRLYGE